MISHSFASDAGRHFGRRDAKVLFLPPCQPAHRLVYDDAA